MTDRITLEEALRIVSFRKTGADIWVVREVFSSVWGSVYGDVDGNVGGNVLGNVSGSVGGNVGGDVDGNVGGTINGREWRSIETPKDKLKRLIEEGADKEQLLEAFNQLEDNND